MSGTYLFDGSDLQLELAAPLACAGGSDFERWLGDVAAEAGVVRAQFHGASDRPELWVMTFSGAMNRLSSDEALRVAARCHAQLRVYSAAARVSSCACSSAGSESPNWA